MVKALSVAVITAGLWMAVTPAIAAPQTTFADLCEGIDYSLWPDTVYGEEIYETTQALLAATGTRNCATAEHRLAQVTDLRQPQLDSVEGDSILTVDLPIVVDLQVIAIATPRLTHLDLNGAVIRDLGPLAKLTELEALHLANTQISDIAPLAQLHQLRVLDVSHNQITAIAPLAELSAIRSLNLAFNPFADLSPLAAIYAVGPDDEPWVLLDLRGVNYDLETCPDILGDICEGDIYGDDMTNF